MKVSTASYFRRNVNILGYGNESFATHTAYSIGSRSYRKDIGVTNCFSNDISVLLDFDSEKFT
jgi:hypothetical protein